jgi:DNA transformation protein and related proteins
MATEESTIEFLLDQLGALSDVRVRPMFGGHVLYHQEKVVALIGDDQLFVKITDPGKAFVGDSYEEGAAYPGAKPSMVIGADVIEDDARLCELIYINAEALPMPKPRKPSKSKKK